jgi:hypothetical protein
MLKKITGMKTAQFTHRIIALLVVSLSLITTLSAQNGKKDKKAEQAAAVKAMIEAQRYVFKAQSVIPTGGRFRQLNTSDYDLKVGKDTIESYLPYFGRAYSAPMDPTQGGIKFTSTKFDYQLKETKKGWEVTIKPTDGGDARQLFMTIFSNGTASLQVTSTNRQPISFNGYIAERKK